MISKAQFIIACVKPNVKNARVRLSPDALVSALVFLGVFALYLRTLPPTVLDGDSGEFQYMAYILGVPHSTGYPLYILLAKLFTFLPFSDIAYRVNLLSAFFAALSAPLIYATARRLLAGEPAGLVANRLACLLATLIFALTPSMWGSAVETKPYSLHLFVGVLVLFFALRWHQEGRPRDFYGFALACGLGLANHVVFRALAPAFLLLLWFNRARLNRALFARAVLLGLLPVLLYAYIPIRANQLIAQQDPANKELYAREDAMVKGTVTAYYNNTPQGFLALISGFDNVYKFDVKSPLESTNRVDLSMTLLLQQFNLACLGFVLAGAWICFRRDRRVFSILLGVALCNGFVAFYLKGISTVFYFSLTYLILSLWIAFGIEAFFQWAARLRDKANRLVASRRILAASASPAVIAPVLFLLPLSALVVNFPKLDESNNYGPRNYAQELLNQDLPQNAVVIAPWEVSQPLRYFQFVENRRPDLLVTNVSPIWPQFQMMLARARELHRPFYNVEFNPELPGGPGPRFVKAIPLPLPEDPHPRYTLSNARVVDDAQVIGYDVSPDPPQPGQPAHVFIYYRVLNRMYPMYSSSLTISDVTGKFWSDYYGFPGSQYDPTYLWKPGETYREEWQFIWPQKAPMGLYNLDLAWFVYDLDKRKTDFDTERDLALGTIRAGDFSIPAIAHLQTVPVGDAITFLGWTGTPSNSSDYVTINRGQPLALDLIWRANRPVDTGYTVFVHLVDATGRVVTDADSPPSSGVYPTDRWVVGELVRDRHTLTIPADLPAGNYGIEIGMYRADTGERLSFGSAVTGVPADHAVLTSVRVP